MMMRMSRAAMAATVIATLAGAAAAAGPEVIFCDVPGKPTASVPGIAGFIFESFDKPYRSPDGSRWIISADTNLPTAEDEVIIVGFGVTGFVVVREGTPMIAGQSELVGLIDTQMGITNNGSFTYATNTDAATTIDEVIVKYDANTGLFSVVAREGDTVPGIAGEAYGIALDSPGILEDGRVCFRAPSTVGVLGTTQDDFIILDNAVFAQAGITIPTGQAGGATNPWELFDLGDIIFSADGTRHIIDGDTTAATTDDDLTTINGIVALQENQPIAGSGLPDLIDNAGIVGVYMSSSGDWMARGNFDVTEIDWLVFNGQIIALTDDLIPDIGTGERYSDDIFADCFFSMVSNDAGDVVFGAVTDNANININGVMLLRRGGVTSVVAREGDPVDLDNNGLFDDDAFLSVFNNDDAFLTNDGWYYFTADLRNTAAANIGQAFMRIRAFTPGVVCRADLTTTAVPGSPGYGVPNGTLNSEDFFYYLAQYGAGNVAVCDLTTTAVPGSPGYGVPNGILNSEDFFFYLALYGAGC